MGMEAIAENLPDKLSLIKLDCTDCRRITEAETHTLKKTLEGYEKLKVDLNIRETEAARYTEAYEQPRKHMAAAFGVSLCIQPDSPQYLKGRKHVVLAVPALVKTLSTDDSWQ